jgi:hypothetical protein
MDVFVWKREKNNYYKRISAFRHDPNNKKEDRTQDKNTVQNPKIANIIWSDNHYDAIDFHINDIKKPYHEIPKTIAEPTKKMWSDESTAKTKHVELVLPVKSAPNPKASPKPPSQKSKSGFIQRLSLFKSKVKTPQKPKASPKPPSQKSKSAPKPKSSSNQLQPQQQTGYQGYIGAPAVALFNNESYNGLYDESFDKEREEEKEEKEDKKDEGESTMTVNEMVAMGGMTAISLGIGVFGAVL